MAYVADLTPYSYIGKRNSELNIGWLQRGHAFETEVPSEKTLDRLWRFCSVAVKQTRGIHGCEFCSPAQRIRVRRDGTERFLGSAEIRVFSGVASTARLRDSLKQIGPGGLVLVHESPVPFTAYAAPNLIYHYVESHHYKPPDEFLRALEEGPCPTSEEYFECLKEIGLDWKKL